VAVLVVGEQPMQRVVLETPHLHLHLKVTMVEPVLSFQLHQMVLGVEVLVALEEIQS
jgi:hypothetical protein